MEEEDKGKQRASKQLQLAHTTQIHLGVHSSRVVGERHAMVKQLQAASGAQITADGKTYSNIDLQGAGPFASWYMPKPAYPVERGR